MQPAHDEQLHATKDDFIERLVSDRNWSFQTAKEAVEAAPGLMQQAEGILNSSIE